MAKQRQIASGVAWGARAPAPPGLFAASRSRRGFTLIELAVVAGLIGLIAFLAIGPFRQGLFRDYGQSSQMRALVNALHLAQWRALKGGISIPIAQGQSQEISNGWYHKVRVTTKFAHDFKVGDWVSFSDIASLPPGPIGHSGLNFGRYMVTAIDGADSPVWFDVSAAGLNDASINDVPQSPPYPAPAPVPMVRNASGAAKLVIIKRSKVRELMEDPSADIRRNASKLAEDPQNFVYDDGVIFIWGYTAAGYPSPEVSGLEPASDYTVTVRFNSRGLPADSNGYQLAVGRTYYDMGKPVPPAKVVTIAPSGKINPGGGD